MGRGRGKVKKHVVINAREEFGSGDEEKISTYKKRGRPQKMLKDDVEEEETEKTKGEEDDDENAKDYFAKKDVKDQAALENGRKRKRLSPVKEHVAKVENGDKTKLSNIDSIKSVGFRKRGSKRKSKPSRAAEVGVRCF